MIDVFIAKVGMKIRSDAHWLTCRQRSSIQFRGDGFPADVKR